MSQKRFYLASASPRRAELLDQMNIKYTIIKPDVDESHLDVIEPIAYNQRVALSKALYAQQLIIEQKLKDLPVIAADTVVVLDECILGKPKNLEQAKATLFKLSGRTHQVYSSVCVKQHQFSETITQISKVTFRELSQDEISGYCRTAEPFDKAGSYAIQGLAAQFIAHLQGSYSGVMGLPLYELFQILAKLDK